MKKIATTIAFAVIALSVLPACGNGSKKCKPCNKTNQQKSAPIEEPSKKAIKGDKEEYHI